MHFWGGGVSVFSKGVGGGHFTPLGFFWGNTAPLEGGGILDFIFWITVGLKISGTFSNTMSLTPTTAPSVYAQDRRFLVAVSKYCWLEANADGYYCTLCRRHYNTGEWVSAQWTTCRGWTRKQSDTTSASPTGEQRSEQRSQQRSSSYVLIKYATHTP